MNSKQFATAATQAIDGFESTSQHLIGAWRQGGERLGSAARQRWDAALKESAPQLSAETRKNAAHAQKVFGGYYAKGIDMGASGAEVAVTTLAQAARTAVQRAAAWQRQART